MFCTIGSSYIVKAGDTLYDIAQQQLGDGNRWREIKKTDGSSLTDNEASNLQAGQEICIPNGSTPPLPSPGGKGNLQNMLEALVLNNEVSHDEFGTSILRYIEEYGGYNVTPADFS
ncbi:MAG: LysM domain-containing protein [Cyanobacteriota bacterium]